MAEPLLVPIACQFTIAKSYRRVHQMLLDLQMGMMSGGPYTRCDLSDVGESWELDFHGVVQVEEDDDEQEAVTPFPVDLHQVLSSLNREGA